jgi:1,4-alpha-glucan branching enzyme
MNIIVHHSVLDSGGSWNLHAWQLAWDGNSVWDPQGTPNGDVIDFQFPNVSDPRELSFKYRSTSLISGESTWEPDDFIRQIVQQTPTEIWTFASSRRILYQDPFPPEVNFKAGDVLTFQVITQNRFRGGQIYAWNPYDSTNPSAFFSQSARDDAAGVSTFTVALANWMTRGFHLKLVGYDPNRNQIWEPDASNRVWRPCDGVSLWLKSGQCDVRNQKLELTPLVLKVLLPSLSEAPTLTLKDVVEGVTFSPSPTGIEAFAGSPLFQVVTYNPGIYPQASYNVTANTGESSPITRPFPANPANLTEASIFALGAGGWLKAFPVVAQSVTLVIEPQNPSSFTAGLSIQLAIGNSTPYQTVRATEGEDQSWTAALTVAQNITTSVHLIPANGNEPTPYPKPYEGWIDTSRYFTPPGSNVSYYTTEGVFGLTVRGKTPFAEPPSRQTLMQAAFGSAVVGTGVFGLNEMPHGATLAGGDVYFVVHAPHAVWAALVLVNENAVGGAAREQIPMTLTPDTLYWWCALSSQRAKPGARYHFIFNDDLEVLDPASREVKDSGSFDVSYGANPSDPTTSWSLVLDVAGVSLSAHTQAWQTMGWQHLLTYEIHAQRFTDLSSGGRMPLDLLVDELQPTSRLGQKGYLWALPVTAFELLPVHEFNSAISWGYDPSFYFAVDGHYGGSAALARFVNAAHQNGRGVLLDVVYNHSLGSSLMKIAPDVYRNGDYDGDRMNCGHPMVGEFLRQATIHIWRTFGVDGFRFDDTQTIVTKCQGGWDFLRMIRASCRTAATAEGRAWPYCVAENTATSPWDISNPGFGVMDGQWGIDEVYRIRDASYDTWNAGSDDAGRVKQEMDNPAYMGRPFFQAVRFGESHDMVSAQDAGNKRIAARPPFGQGLQMAKALGALTLLSNGIPMLFMGQEAGETTPFSFDSSAPALNPQKYNQPPSSANENAQVLAWFRQLMGLRNDPSQGLQGETNYQVVQIGNRTVAFTCGLQQCLFVVVTFGTANQQQNSSWLGLPAGSLFKEIFNSSWPDFQVESESQRSNGGYDARIGSGQILNLPYIGAVVLQRV